MQILNLTNVDKSDIKWSVSCFPDGEVQITLEGFSRKDSIAVKCRITNAEELFILCQVNDILTRHGVDWDLEIYYLMGMRMDRVMDFNRPFTLSIVAKVLRSFSCNNTGILEPHSNRTLSLLAASTIGNVIPNELIVGTQEFSEKYNLVLPDEGAYKRMCETIKRLQIPATICRKTRDVSTGKLTGFEIANPSSVIDASRPLMIVDDLCDGGGTFCGIATEIRKVRPDIQLNIFVTHMVNYEGITNLSKTFDQVYFTNSYRDWESRCKLSGARFPKNVTQINII